MNVDFISDIHIDFWVGINGSPKKQESTMHTLIKMILPEDKSDTLVIAGDIGHYNAQNEGLFKVLREYYKNVIWVHGNHDLYMVSSSVKKNFNCNSLNRLNDMIERSNKIDGVHYLNGDIIEIDGIKIGGCAMWYNYDYAMKVWAMTHKQAIEMWQYGMNDANYIQIPKKDTGMIDQIDNEEYFFDQLKLLEKIYLQCDIIVTHTIPDWTRLIPKYQEPFSTCYVFDGRQMLKKLDNTKMWAFGHTHNKYFYTHEYGCTMICNPLDYAIPNWQNNKEMEHKKIVSMEVGKLKSYEDVFNESDTI